MTVAATSGEPGVAVMLLAYWFLWGHYRIIEMETLMNRIGVYYGRALCRSPR